MSALDLAGVGRAVADASLLAALGVLLVGGLLAICRRLPAGWQAWLWWLVGARVLLELAGVPAIEWRILPATPIASAAMTAEAAASRSVDFGAAASAIDPDRSPAPAAGLPGTGLGRPAERRWSLDPWSAFGAAWLIGALLSLAIAARGLLRVRRLLARSVAIDDGPIRAALAAARETLGVTKEVEVLRSDEIDSPMAAGLLRPRIVLPSGVELTPAELELAFLHELTHLRRRDGWRAIVPALASRLLFFHPFVRHAEREFVLAVEAACDDRVVTGRTSTPELYGRLLVRFARGERPRPAIATTWPLAASAVKRRLEMMINGPFDRRRLAWAAPLVALSAIALGLPLRLVAASAQEVSTDPAGQSAVAEEASATNRSSPLTSIEAEETESPPAAPAAPRPTVAPRTTVAPVASPKVSLPALAQIAPPMPLQPPRPVEPTMPPLPPVPPLTDLGAVDWMILIDGEDRWVIGAPHAALARAERLVAAGGGVLLVRRDATTWLTRDPEAIGSVKGLVESQLRDARSSAREAMELAGAEQEELARMAPELRRQLEVRGLEEEFRARRVEQLAQLESRRLHELREELMRLRPELSEQIGFELEATADQLARIQEQLSVLVERERAERLQRREVVELERRERLEHREQERKELSRLREQLRAERETAARERNRELDNLLEDLFEAGRLTPIDDGRD